MTSQMLIDCAVHPQVKRPDDLRDYMVEPWRSRPFPRPERYYYPVLSGEFMPGSASKGLAGSDPAHMAEELFDKGKVDTAILIPLTRGLMPEVDLGDAICRATNDWVSDQWLDGAHARGRLRGAIRVNPSNPQEAVSEIERWAGDPKMACIAVSLQSHHPYGQRHFFPIWETAARHRLPVVIKLDAGSGVDFWPTAVGYPHYYAEYSTLAPLAFAYHLISFIAEGVFERLPDLKIVFADGGHDMLAPLIWRMDKNWRPTRREMPWSQQLPSAVLARHVRFCTHKLTGPIDMQVANDWLAMSDAASLLVYGSRYPYYDFEPPQDTLAGLSDGMKVAIAGATAASTFRL